MWLTILANRSVQKCAQTVNFILLRFIRTLPCIWFLLWTDFWYKFFCLHVLDEQNSNHSSVETSKHDLSKLLKAWAVLCGVFQFTLYCVSVPDVLEKDVTARARSCYRTAFPRWTLSVSPLCQQSPKSSVSCSERVPTNIYAGLHHLLPGTDRLCAQLKCEYICLLH